MQTMTVFTVAAVMFSRSALNLSRFLGKKWIGGKVANS